MCKKIFFKIIFLFFTFVFCATNIHYSKKTITESKIENRTGHKDKYIPSVSEISNLDSVLCLHISEYDTINFELNSYAMLDSVQKKNVLECSGSTVVRFKNYRKGNPMLKFKIISTLEHTNTAVRFIEITVKQFEDMGIVTKYTIKKKLDKYMIGGKYSTLKL